MSHLLWVNISSVLVNLLVPVPAALASHAQDASVQGAHEEVPEDKKETPSPLAPSIPTSGAKPAANAGVLPGEEAMDADSSDAESSDAESSDAESSDAESSDAESSDAESSNAESSAVSDVVSSQGTGEEGDKGKNIPADLSLTESADGPGGVEQAGFCGRGSQSTAWRETLQHLSDEKRYAKALSFLGETSRKGGLSPEDYLFLKSEEGRFFSILGEGQKAQAVYRVVLILDPGFVLPEGALSSTNGPYEAARLEVMAEEKPMSATWVLREGPKDSNRLILWVGLENDTLNLIQNLSVAIGETKQVQTARFGSDNSFSLLVGKEIDEPLAFCFMDEWGNGVVEEVQQISGRSGGEGADIRYLSVLGASLLGVGFIGGAVSGLGLVAGARGGQLSQEQMWGLYGVFFLSGALMGSGGGMVLLEHFLFPVIPVQVQPQDSSGTTFFSNE